MHVPTQLLNEKSFQKHRQKTNNTAIFSDKVVDRRTEPLLFNIEYGLQTVGVNVDGNQSKMRSTEPQRSQQDGARNLLQQLNVVYSPEPKDFSLLSSTAGQTTSENKNIIDSVEYTKTFNISVLAVDKFPTNIDPFYKIDEGNTANSSYEKETIGGVIVNPPDLSKMASGVVTLNLSTKYHGQSKYFLSQGNVTTQ
jgi:hypothetical protein